MESFFQNREQPSLRFVLCSKLVKDCLSSGKKNSGGGREAGKISQNSNWKKLYRKWINDALLPVHLSKRCPWARHLNVRGSSVANSSKLWLYTVVSSQVWTRCCWWSKKQQQSRRCVRSVWEQAVLSICYRCRSVQVSCWEDPGFGTSQETSGVHVYPRMQRGWNICPGLSHHPLDIMQGISFTSLTEIFDCTHILLCICCDVYYKAIVFGVIYLFASAGPVPYSDRLLLVCHQWRQASEWLLCAQQDPGVFRYWGETSLATCGWNVQSFKRVLNWCARLCCQHSFHLSCLCTAHISD